MTQTLTSPPPGLAEPMSLMEHLVELRSRVVRCAVAVAIGAAVGWVLYLPVLHLLMGPLRDLSGNPNVSSKFLSQDPLEIFLLRIKLSAYIGIILAMPYLLWQVWRFISPGLYQQERRYATAFVSSATVLFLLGAAIAFFTVTPRSAGWARWCRVARDALRTAAALPRGSPSTDRSRG